MKWNRRKQNKNKKQAEVILSFHVYYYECTLEWGYSYISHLSNYPLCDSTQNKNICSCQ